VHSAYGDLGSGLVSPVFQIFSPDGLGLSAAVDVIEPRMEVDETQSGFGFTPRNEILNGRAAQVRDQSRPLRFAGTCDKNRRSSD
jgi:hypothetical protein